MYQAPQPREELADENLRLKAQVAQLEDRLDHVMNNGNGNSVAKEGARAIADQERLYAATMAAMSDVVLLTDDAGRLAYVSPNVSLIFGHSRDDVKQQGRIGFLLPSGLFDPDVLEQRGEVANIECRIRDSVGRSRDLLVSVKRVALPEGNHLYTCRDVTERRRIEMELDLLKVSLDRKVDERIRELRESREQYRRLVEGLRDEYFFYSVRPDGTITYISPSVQTILGYTPDQCLGKNWREFVDPVSDSFRRSEERERKHAAGQFSPPDDVELTSASGAIVVIEVRDVPIYDDGGQILFTEGMGRDITARRKAELELEQARDHAEKLVVERTAELQAANDRLRASEFRYRSVVEDNPDFIVRWEPGGKLTLVNEAYCRYFNESPENLLERHFLSSIVAEDLEELEQRLASVTREAPLVVHEHRTTLPNGRVVWHRWSHRGLFDSEGKLAEFQSVGSDITSRRAAEDHTRDKAVAEAKVNVLTPRESDVMRWVVAGDANKVIARKLDLSIKTIEKHRSSLMRKLQVRSVPELVRLAMLADSNNDGL